LFFLSIFIEIDKTSRREKFHFCDRPKNSISRGHVHRHA